ncbi:hypothetical protein GCM10023168_18120 [Fodinibacter luteus]|uniref:Uncharacterized protein n=1 Tax=Fodinibacter luteus TaxID=552064 RepID=A0ABP8KFH3_9MICO
MPGGEPEGEPMELVVRCRASPTAQDARTHRVTIHPDWSVTTPHDLDAERVGMALGGYCSCVELVDMTIPALRSVIDVLTNPVTAEVEPTKAGGWTVRRTHACCRSREFAGIVQAARHLRSATHLVKAVRARRRRPLDEAQFEEVLAGFERIRGSFQQAPRHRAEALVREPGGLDDLWVCGIAPDQVERLAAVAVGVREPLPVAYFLALVYRSVDPEWLGEAVARCPDPDIATWLAWQDAPHDRAPAAQWGGWLALGVPRRALLALLDVAVPVQRAYALATALAAPAPVLARELGTWALAGCTPTLGHFLVLRDHGITAATPSTRALDLLCAEVDALLAGRPAAVARTDLAVLLEVLGTRHAVHAVIRRGVRQAGHLRDVQAVDRCLRAAG